MRSGNVSAKALRAAAILAWLAALIFIRTPAVSAQQSDDLQQQIKQLKQEYEQAIADFQKRLAGPRAEGRGAGYEGSGAGDQGNGAGDQGSVNREKHSDREGGSPRDR